MAKLFVSWSEGSWVRFRMQNLEVLLFQLLMKRKCDPLMVSMFLVNLKCLKITWAKVDKASDLRPLRCTSLSLTSLWEVVQR